MLLTDLLPTIVVFKRTLEELKKNKAIVHCKPLVNAVYNGVCSRFDELFYDNELRVASLNQLRWSTLSTATNVSTTSRCDRKRRNRKKKKYSFHPFSNNFVNFLYFFICLLPYDCLF